MEIKKTILVMDWLDAYAGSEQVARMYLMAVILILALFLFKKNPLALYKKNNTFTRVFFNKL